MTDFIGTEFNDTIDGTDGDDTISGLAGDDVLRPHTGHDTIDGGEGTDRLFFEFFDPSYFPGELPEGPHAYTLTGNTLFDDSGTLDATFANIETIYLTDFSGEEATVDASGLIGPALVFSATGGIRSYKGSAGVDFINVEAGSATIDGGDGRDRLAIDADSTEDSPLVVTRSGDLAVFEDASGAIVSARNVELILIAPRNYDRSLFVDASQFDASIYFFGGEFADRVVGSTAGDFLLDFGANDVIAGGAGADTFYLDIDFDFAPFGGLTVLDLEADDMIAVELAGPGGFLGTGAFTGVAGEFRYYTWRGETFVVADTDGDGVGDNTARFANGAFALAETTPGSKVLQIVGPPGVIAGTDDRDLIVGGAADDAINGRGGDDWINGAAGNDEIWGGSGDDAILGGPGRDRLDGGTGIDFADYSGVAAGVRVSLAKAGAQNTVGGGIDTLVGIENLVGSAFADTLIGDAGVNLLDGGAGNDTLDGGVGADTLRGGAGNDSYFVDDAGDVVVELAGQGSDRVTSTIDYVLGARVEGLTLRTDNARNGTGNGLDNTIQGSSAKNTLLGLDGADALFGNSGNDLLDGGSGDDVLAGGFNKDTLTGGAGLDQFAFGEGETSALRGQADVIVDFSHAQADRIKLNLIDANAELAGDQKFAFLKTGAFTGVAGQLHYVHDAGATFVEGDTNGDGLADFTIKLNGVIDLVGADFVL